MHLIFQECMVNTENELLCWTPKIELPTSFQNWVIRNMFVDGDLTITFEGTPKQWLDFYAGFVLDDLHKFMNLSEVQEQYPKEVNGDEFGKLLYFSTEPEITSTKYKYTPNIDSTVSIKVSR